MLRRSLQRWIECESKSDATPPSALTQQLVSSLLLLMLPEPPQDAVTAKSQHDAGGGSGGGGGTRSPRPLAQLRRRRPSLTPVASRQMAAAARARTQPARRSMSGLALEAAERTGLCQQPGAAPKSKHAGAQDMCRMALHLPCHAVGMPGR